MIPSFYVSVKGDDYTKEINDRLVEFRIADIAGYKSDYFEVTLDDRDSMPRPAHGASIEVQIGYEGQELVDKGKFTHHETIFEGPPQRMTVRAAAVNFRDTLKSQRTRSFDNVTLGDLVAAVASEHNYDSFVDEFLKDITIPHIDQTDESDLLFLTRLSTQYGATFKASAGLLVFFMSGGKKSDQLREALGSVTLKPEDVSTWSIAERDTGRVTAVTAKWHDYDAAATKTIKVGAGDIIRAISKTFPTEAEAYHAAQSKLDRLLRLTVSVSITLPGRPELIAEGGLVLEEFRDGVDNDYVIDRVDHIITKSGGYKTKIEASLDKK